MLRGTWRRRLASPQAESDLPVDSVCGRVSSSADFSITQFKAHVNETLNLVILIVGFLKARALEVILDNNDSERP